MISTEEEVLYSWGNVAKKWNVTSGRHQNEYHRYSEGEGGSGQGGSGQGGGEKSGILCVMQVSLGLEEL